MRHNLKQAVESVIDYYTNIHKVYGRGNDYYYNSYPNLDKRLIYILDKIIVPYKRHPELFDNKSILDFGCGTGEHSYFLSHFANTITSYDPQIIHYNWINTLFTGSNQVNVVKNEDSLYYSSFDTVFISGVLECIEDYGGWLEKLINKLSFNNLILVFSPDYDKTHINSGQSLRQTRLYDNNVHDTTVYEDVVLKATNSLTLFDKCSFETRQSIHDHKKVIHFYKR